MSMNKWFFCVICIGAVAVVGCGGGAPPSKPSSSGGSGGGSSEKPATAEASTVKPASEGDPEAKWGDLKGRFVLDGEAPTPAPVKVTKDQDFCGPHNLVDESVVVSPDGKLANVVVFLYQKRGDDPPEVHPDYAAGLEAPAAIDNDKCRFEPRVVVVQTGQKLVIGNKDAVAHNSKVATISNPEINPIIPGGDSTDVTFEKGERSPASVTCSIHPWMQGYIVVAETPYAAVTDANGEFVIKNVPVGEWTFAVWHEKVGFVETAMIGGNAIAWKKGRVDVEIGGGVETDLGEVGVALP